MVLRGHIERKKKNISLGGLPEHALFTPAFKIEVLRLVVFAKSFRSRVEGIGYTTRGFQTENATRRTLLMHASQLQDLCHKTIPENNAADTVIPGRLWMLSSCPHSIHDPLHFQGHLAQQEGRNATPQDPTE